MKPRIVVPFDFSEGAERALRWAATLQRATGAGPIRLVHALSTIPLMDGETMLALHVPNDDEVAGLERSMLATAEQCGATASARVLVEGNEIKDMVLQAAEEPDVDLVVMGTHGRSGLTRLLIGSVAEHLLRHAPCPVVTVRNLGPRKSEKTPAVPPSPESRP